MPRELSDRDETSLSAELTPRGVKARSNSRAIAALDRLVGNVTDWGSLFFERNVVVGRAKIDGERQLIDAATKYAVQKIGKDEAFAKRAFENHFRKIARIQANKDAVAAEAIIELQENPQVGDEEDDAEAPHLSDEFLDAFEQYAEGASTDELRRRWGRVLAGEIRRPGTFSAKVLRATAELDNSTAVLFEALCQHRIDDAIPICLSGILDLEKRHTLVESELFVETGETSGRYVRQALRWEIDGHEIWAIPVGSNWRYGISKGYIPPIAIDHVLTTTRSAIGAPIYLLTEVGRALASILPYSETDASIRIMEKLDSHVRYVSHAYPVTTWRLRYFGPYMGWLSVPHYSGQASEL